MTLQEIKSLLETESPEDVVKRILERDTIAVFPQQASYIAFKARVAATFAADEIFIMGSANLGFSLDPDHLGRPFSEDSDIDVVLISESLHKAHWEHVRHYHRSYYYQVPYRKKEQLKRNGQNVYSGFVSPEYILDRIHPRRTEFDFELSRLSDASVGFRDVSALFFSSRVEVYDYYKRSLMPLLAQL